VDFVLGNGNVWGKVREGEDDERVELEIESKFKSGDRALGCFFIWDDDWCGEQSLLIGTFRDELVFGVWKLALMVEFVSRSLLPSLHFPDWINKSTGGSSLGMTFVGGFIWECFEFKEIGFKVLSDELDGRLPSPCVSQYDEGLDFTVSEIIVGLDSHEGVFKIDVWCTATEVMAINEKFLLE